MKLNDLLTEMIDDQKETKGYIVRDLARKKNSWKADTKKDIINAIMANAIIKWQIQSVDTDEILADYQDHSILSGNIVSRNKAFEKIKELVFSNKDDIPNHEKLPRSKMDMEIVDHTE